MALVGPSGAGKTTIVNLMLRLFDVEEGRILIDGQDIRSLTQASLREQFGVVSQEAMLMHRSIRDNIGYGREGATQAEIVDAAKRAAAHDFIVDVADPRGRRGYDAHVGERGVKLSGGQRQRVAIARMMLKDAPILILDEATSALDSEVEAAIQDNLYRLMEGKTVIAIAHRLSTIAALDRLIVVDEGRIVEEGTHESCIARGGLYAQLWKRQSGGFLGRPAGRGIDTRRPSQRYVGHLAGSSGRFGAFDAARLRDSCREGGRARTRGRQARRSEPGTGSTRRRSRGRRSRGAAERRRRGRLCLFHPARALRLPPPRRDHPRIRDSAGGAVRLGAK